MPRSIIEKTLRIRFVQSNSKNLFVSVPMKLLNKCKIKKGDAVWFDVTKNGLLIRKIDLKVIRRAIK